MAVLIMLKLTVKGFRSRPNDFSRSVGGIMLTVRGVWAHS